MFDTEMFFRSRRGKFAQEFYYFNLLESTNETASALARGGCPEGTTVLANEQTKGRGRKGNVWHSPPELNLYFSIVLYPKLSQIKYLPFVAGLAVIKALEKNGLKSDLKWPNDVLVGGKKISGVMAETSIEQNQLQYAVLGCGVNVNEITLPVEIQDSATTVAIEKGSIASREELLASLVLELETLYFGITTISWEEFCAEVERSSTYIQGCPVRIRQDENIFEGVTAGLDAHGGLILTTSNEKKIFYAGDVQACRKN